MAFVKNYKELAKSAERKIVLDLIEAAIFSIQPENVFGNSFKLNGNQLKILDKTIDLSVFRRIFLLGFGKGSAANCAIIERTLGDRLDGGWDIDAVDARFSKVEYTKGTHPLVSATNVEFTQKVIDKLSHLGEHDLVLIVTCGGGSALLESPTVPLKTLIAVNEALLESGANIHDMNVVRKHLSRVKGGGLAKIIYPAKAVNLIFSDVPGNDLTVIASAPTIPDPTTQDEAWNIYTKFGIDKKVPLKKEDFTQTTSADRSPRSEGRGSLIFAQNSLHPRLESRGFFAQNKAFENIDNILFLSNSTALEAMQNKANDLGVDVRIYSDHFEGEAKEAGAKLVSECSRGILLVGGETTVRASGGGSGGRNQEVVLGVLGSLPENTIVASFDSDGWDNSPFAGAIGDKLTVKRARDLNLDVQSFLNRNDSLNFFKQTGDGIETGRLDANVADLIVVYRYD
ncbi:hypothetical protein A2870_01200 [Candidatus Curtissbacteria bacterium RIFCSPHIGHO2_01_FULL_41_11]|uniref:Glycerate kinase n=1 Tax=Candidatus Curtissbacteria bacterium RIFCSPHIGHO2_01_FULL_41_11 TaxID=1797711 RepID=A0A1F5G8M3_9BACT|nr:MAG: hypothetical protein A2870_01200 [Candidatus Curtissbacteria bacterium RIFCSPHIGHO2_01_FULL_41_11]